MRKLMQDLRFTIRQLRRSPGFAVTTTATLALGIGATTAIFTLVNAVVLRPLPFPDQDRLMSVREGEVPPGTANAPSIPDVFSYPDYFDWRSQNHSFTGMASYRDDSTVLSNRGEARHLPSVVVSANFFRVLGVRPMLGRGFQNGDEQPGKHVVMLSYRLWQSDFGSSPEIVGRNITLNSRSYTVAGVMPPEFSFPIENAGPALWTTLADDDEMRTQRGAHMLEVIARLKPGVSPAQARADVMVIARNLAAQYPDMNKTSIGAFVKPELELLVGDTRPALRVLFAAVGLLLLIACANVAGLLLARGSRRAPEIAIRTALGAGRTEIIRQMLVESVFLSVCGGTLGIGFARGILDLLLRFVPKDLPRIHDVSVDVTVLAFVTIVSVLTGLLFGMLPALRASRVDFAPALREGRGISAGRRQHRLHDALVIGETAIGLLLLAGSGLLIRSFVHTINVNPGFNPQHVLTASLDVSDTRYPKLQRVRFYDELLARVAALPGVRSVAAGWPLPLSGNDIGISFGIEGRPIAKGDEPAEDLALVTPGYFRTLQIPVLSGRAFTDRDTSQAAAVMIVSEQFARKYFPGENAVGKHVEPGLGDGILKHPMREIVGVVGDIKHRGLTTETRPTYYLPFAQAVITAPTLVIRTAGDPASLIEIVRSQVAAMDKQVPVYDAAPMGNAVYHAASQPRFQTMLLTSFAVLALLLSAVGLYAVLSYMVVQRTHEIGLRMAVGAQRTDILRLVVRHGFVLSIGGLAIGLVLTTALTQFMSGMLYGVRPTDPLTLIAVSALLLLVSLTASSVPAFRAARLDPVNTLREQ